MVKYRDLAVGCDGGEPEQHRLLVRMRTMGGRNGYWDFLRHRINGKKAHEISACNHPSRFALSGEPVGRP